MCVSSELLLSEIYKNALATDVSRARVGRLPSKDLICSMDVSQSHIVAQQEMHGVYVVGTGFGHGVANVARAGFAHVVITARQTHVRPDEAFVRLADPAELVGDVSRLHTIVRSPSVAFEEIAARLLEADLDRFGDATI